MSEASKTAISVTLTIGLGIALIMWIGHNFDEEPAIVKLVPVQALIPSQREIQQRLKDLGKARYDPGKIDGIIGKDSRIAWDNYICDQLAKKAIEGR